MTATTPQQLIMAQADLIMALQGLLAAYRTGNQRAGATAADRVTRARATVEERQATLAQPPAIVEGIRTLLVDANTKVMAAKDMATPSQRAMVRMLGKASEELFTAVTLLPGAYAP